MFKFFVLSNSGSGEARRHFPFTSIIHKHVLPLFFVLVVLLFSSVPVSVSALAVPEIEPIYDTTITQLYELVNTRMTTTQEDVFNLLLGTYAVGYAGFGQYHLRYIHADNASVREWLINTGVDIYNTLVDFGLLSVDTLNTIQPVLNTALACAEKALTYDPEDALLDFLDDVDSSSNYMVSFSPELQLGLNQFFALNGGLYNWQQSVGPWVTNGFVYNQASMNNNEQVQYVQLLDILPQPYVKFNQTAGSKSFRAGDLFFSTYHNLFINTTDHILYLIDDDGNIYGSSSKAVSAVNYYNGNVRITTSVLLNRVGYLSYNSSDFNNLVSLAQAYFDNYFSESGKEICFSDFVDTVYYGPNLQSRQILDNTSDLGFEDNDYEYVLAPIENILLDLKGLLSDLVDTNELKPPVINNIYNYNNQPVPESALQKVSVTVQLPDSGIIVPPSLFGGFFDSNKGFISYLWFMTIPLVVYTHDLLDCFWFGPEGDFDWSGPAPIVFGVISLGLIGGLIVKMLL